MKIGWFIKSKTKCNRIFKSFCIVTSTSALIWDMPLCAVRRAKMDFFLLAAEPFNVRLQHQLYLFHKFIVYMFSTSNISRYSKRSFSRFIIFHAANTFTKFRWSFTADFNSVNLPFLTYHLEFLETLLWFVSWWRFTLLCGLTYYLCSDLAVYGSLNKKFYFPE